MTIDIKNILLPSNNNLLECFQGQRSKVAMLLLSFMVLNTHAVLSINKHTDNSIQNMNVSCAGLPDEFYVNPTSEHNDQLEQKVNSLLNSQPVRFIENKGQIKMMNGVKVLFSAEIPGMRLLITEKGLTYIFMKYEKEGEEKEEKIKKSFNKYPEKEKEQIKVEMSWINVTLKDAFISSEQIVAEKASITNYNYIYPHCPSGVYGVNEFEKVTIKNVYPMIDWVFYNSSKGGMKYDFVIHSGANPDIIKLLYEGDKPLKLNKDGSIEIRSKLGKLSEAKPFCYLSDSKLEVSSSYKITSLSKHASLLEYNLGYYDRNHSLIVDPQLVWGTFYGGDGADGFSTMKADNNGNVFVSGYLSGTTDLPVLNVPGSYFQAAYSSGIDAFALKFSNTGVLLWATYFGGVGSEQIYSMDFDSLGNLFMVGLAAASNFPIQNLPGAYNQANSNGIDADALILKFSNTGALLWSTYFGGSGFDEAHSIDFDNAGNFFVGGFSASGDFPFQSFPGAYTQPFVANDGAGFIAKFSNTGSLLWSTSYGGSNSDNINAIALDMNNNLYLTGNTFSTDLPIVNFGSAYSQPTLGGFTDVFIAKFSASGAIQWSTYYGGSDQDDAYSIAVDDSNHVYIMGTAYSSNFPIQNLSGAFNQPTGGNQFDIFLLKFDANGTRKWATYIGGSDQEGMGALNNSLAIDACNNVFIAFVTFSTDIAAVPYQLSCGGFNDTLNNIFNSDFFIMQFSSKGELIWSTFVGGDGGEFRSLIALDSDDNLFISGEWTSVTDNSTYPLVDPGGGSYFDPSYNLGLDDGFIMKFIPVQPTYATSKLDSDVCGNCNGKAEVTVVCGQAPYTFTWSNGVVESNVNVANSSIASLCPGNYSVNVSWGCTNDTVFSFVINGSTAVNITASSVNGTCGQANGTATAAATGGSGTYTYAWSNGATGSFITGLTSGNYTVIGTDNNGCTDTTQVIVNTSPASGVILTSNDTILGLNETATLQILGGDTYNWTPSTSLSCDDCFSVIASPTVSTTYTVTGTDSVGCPYLRVINVIVDIVCNELFVPNIFSPNGVDNIENEKFCIYNNCIKTMNLGIYNRWGELIFSTDNQTTCWDGTHKGLPVMSGVYTYRLFVEQLDGNKIEQKGNITLTR
jgi:gliding motility-associated-like protein